MHYLCGCFILAINILLVQCQNLQTVGDDDLLQLIKSKEKLIVLFTKPNCEPCSILEKTLESLQEEFSVNLKTDTVQSVSSHLSKLYSPTKEPAIVFFRHGIPLLYSGEPNENDIYMFFEQNQQPAVKELTDQIFEHITQAATGATTGDWFVMFYGASCVECQRLHAVWEGVGATLRSRVNVARLDASLAGASTAKRFRVGALPTFLFFRLGKVYRFELPRRDVKTFVSFAQDWYKNARGEAVPLLSSPFDEVVDYCVELLKFATQFGLNMLEQHPWIWQIGLAVAAGFGLVAMTALIALFKARAPTRDSKKDKKSK